MGCEIGDSRLIAFSRFIPVNIVNRFCVYNHTVEIKKGSLHKLLFHKNQFVYNKVICLQIYFLLGYRRTNL